MMLRSPRQCGDDMGTTEMIWGQHGNHRDNMETTGHMGE